MKKSEAPKDGVTGEGDLSVERLRFERLLPFAKARGKALTDEDGEPIDLDLLDELPKLTAELHVGADWIRRRVAEIAAMGWQHASPNDFVMAKSDGGRGKSRLKPDILAAVLDAIEFACGEVGLKPSKTEAITTAINFLLLKRGIPEEEIPARGTISQMMKSALGWAAYAGPYRNEHENRPGLERRKADALQANVVLDWTGLSQDHRELIVVTDDFLVAGRANLISAIDEASRIPWGWMWCVGAPNSDLIGECVSNGLLEKTSLVARAGLKGRYPIAGRPLVLRHDHGRDMIGKNTKRIIKECGIRFDECSPVRTPHYNGIQERFQGSAKRMFLDYVTRIKLRGKTAKDGPSLDDPEKDYKKDKKTKLESSRIYIRWSELETYWIRWLMTEYCVREHKGLYKYTPLQRYDELIRGKGFHLTGSRKPILDSWEFRWRFLATKMVHHFRGAVEIKKRVYSSYELNKAVGFTCHTLRSPFEVRWNEYDLSKIYYKTGAKVIAVPLTKPADLPACSRWEWRAAITDLKRADILNPSAEEIARLVRARKEKMANWDDKKDQTVITNADRINHLMHCVMRDRFKRVLDCAKGAATIELVARPPKGATTLEEAEVPKLGRRRPKRSKLEHAEAKLLPMRKRKISFERR